ncbi:11314_t:CDS:2, partial [Gigaspora margarita]
DFILSDNSVLCSCAKVLDIDCILAAISSSMASSSGLLGGYVQFWLVFGHFG